MEILGRAEALGAGRAQLPVMGFLIGAACHRESSKCAQLTVLLFLVFKTNSNVKSLDILYGMKRHVSAELVAQFACVHAHIVFGPPPRDKPDS